MPPQARDDVPNLKPDNIAAAVEPEADFGKFTNLAPVSTNWQYLAQIETILSRHGIIGRKKVTVLIVLVLALLLFVTFYTFHRGFRRTVQFWSRTLPWVVEYYSLKYYSTLVVGRNETEWEKIQHDFHALKAPKAVQMVQDMGGIYVKTGQALSTMGSGILPEEYVQALRPLQDGVAPRDYQTISSIIEKSTGQKMNDIFESFEETPIGAATIGQAHRAVLKKQYTTHDKSQEQRQVIVKVQYPEVAELFDFDLRNLEWLVWMIMPHRTHHQLKNMRKRHEREMDFRDEANNLRECSQNMHKYGLEPGYVRIPRVLNETGLCTKEVLVMEYLDGVSLRDVMEEEQDRIARALGKKDAEELRYVIAKQVREHFQQGGGDAQGGAQMKLIGAGGGSGGSKPAKVLSVMGPFAIHAVRRYARLRDQFVRFLSQVPGVGSKTTKNEYKELKKAYTRNIDLGKVLKTIIYAHALQIMRDGVYNQDPHPGNVLILEDGRVGLLDYGMVGRISDEEREKFAQAIVALARNDAREVANLYLDEGYHVTWKGEKVTDPNMLHKLSVTHLDKIDLSPVTLTDDAGGMKNNPPKHMDIKELYTALDVIFVPDWLVQTRRVARLLMGVSAQAARPVSLAKEWAPVAKLVLKESKSQRKRKRIA